MPQTKVFSSTAGNSAPNAQTPRDGAFYTYNGTAAITTIATIPYGTAVKDTNNCVSGGVYTAKTAGWHTVSGSYETNSVTWASADFITLSITVNATTYFFRTVMDAAVTQSKYVSGTLTVYLAVGDTVAIQAAKASSATPTFSGTATRNVFSVVYVGP